MQSASASDERATAATRAFASICALALCGAFLIAQRHDILGFNGVYRDPVESAVLLALLTGMFVGLPWLPTAHRVVSLLSCSVLVGALVMRWLIVVPLLFAWLAVKVSRSAWSNTAKLTLLLAAWCAVAVAGWFAPNVHGLRYLPVAAYWGCLPAPLICLVVERARGQLDGIEPTEEWLYLIGAPRLVAPFLQPIGASRFIRSRRDNHSPRLAASALGLGLYAIVGFLVIRYTHYSLKTSSEPLSFSEHSPRILRNLLRVYAYNSTAIFFSVSLLRLFSYDLGSGFRFPLLAASPSDAYRRWNYYFFEFATSIYYLPIVGWCRRRMPLGLAYVLAGYSSFFFGMWVLDRAASFPASRYAAATLAEATNWHELLAYAAVWSTVIWSQLLLAPARRLRKHRWFSPVARTGTLLVAVLIMVTLFCLGVPLY